MDLMQDTKLKNTYDQCRYQVKLWEHHFKKKNGRLPSKLDIREASKDVRNAYKIYFRLKTAALEESLMHIDGFEAEPAPIVSHNVDAKEILHDVIPETVPHDTIPELTVPEENNAIAVNNYINSEDTWGVHLNKSKNVENGSKVADKKLRNVNLSFTQKLFERSTSLKRLPRKSLSFTRKKSDSEPLKSQSLSQPEYSSFIEEINDEFISKKTASVKTTLSITTQPINLIQNVIINKNYSDKPVRQLDAGWIQRVTQNTGTEFANDNCTLDSKDYDSDDIVPNSEDEEESSYNIYHIAKKHKTLNNNESNTKTENALVTVDATTKRLNFSNIFTSTSDEKNNCKSDKKQDVYEFETEPNEKSLNTSKKSNKTESHITKHNKNQPVRRKNIKGSTKLPAGKKSKLPETKNDNENETYELEYSIKPRVITVPRIKNIKQVIKKAREQKKESLQPNADDGNKNADKEKLKQKIISGTLNENYVQINLKKKIYVRGKKTMTYSKFKKQQWKKKKNALYGPDMNMDGCDGGTLTCFKCGQDGHFARQCNLSKVDSLLPLEDDEGDCAYPTLEEAAKMAKESELTIRVPNQIQTNGQINDEQIEKDNLNNVYFQDDFDLELLAETERLEQEISKIDVRKYLDTTSYIKPYYDLKEDGSIIETPQKVFKTLQKFGYETFRPGQEEAIMRILSGKSTLVTLSTGSGKSLCYQLPAYLYSQRKPCISLIISPLVSLMEDQVTGIPAFLKAACLHTNQTTTQRNKIMEAINAGNLNILLVSPEAVVAGEKSSGFGSLLRKLPPIAFACIDEAHCVSQWSHNFRPSYLKICHVLRDRLGINTVLGLTATATRATSDSIIEHLHIPDGTKGIISDIPLPNNLKLTVSRDVQRDQALLGLLMSERFANCKSIIIYCTRRDECERIAGFLRTSLGNDSKKRKRGDFQAKPYHAGMSASKRKSIQKAFMNGELRIVVATVAFGMGINKSDIRAVIHYNMPRNFESYVQEIGRAGRDGLPAHCHLFLDSQGNDENELRRHIYANSIDRHVIRKLLQRCFIPCSCKTHCPRHEVAFSIQETVKALDIREENIETLLCYLELHDKRYVELLSHAYVTCKIISYGNFSIIHKAAKTSPPLAMALALYQNKNDVHSNIFEFPIVEVASAMGWDSGICKHKLKNLEWITENNQSKRSKLSVQFSNLGFRLLAPGNLSDCELDAALDSLHKRVQEQEQTSLLQLHAVHGTLLEAARPSFKMCILDEEINENEKLLKYKIREYFENPAPLELLSKLDEIPINEEQVIADTRSLIFMYQDNTFTGRTVARIFHGIESPNYSALMWRKCKFWRAHLRSNFNDICKIATKEILRMRS